MQKMFTVVVLIGDKSYKFRFLLEQEVIDQKISYQFIVLKPDNQWVLNTKAYNMYPRLSCFDYKRSKGISTWFPAPVFDKQSAVQALQAWSRLSAYELHTRTVSRDKKEDFRINEAGVFTIPVQTMLNTKISMTVVPKDF